MEKQQTQTEKSSNIRQNFETMEYPKGRVNTDEAEAWLQTFNANIEMSEEDVKERIHSPISLDILKNNQLVVLLNRFADSLEDKINIICQLEIKCRGILIKDTRHSMKIFIENLRYFSSWAADTKTQIIKDEDLIIIPNTCSLLMMGYVFAACLSNGHCLYLHTGKKVSPVINFLVNEAIATGFPEHLLTIIPENLSVEYMARNFVFNIFWLHNTFNIELRNMSCGFHFFSIAGSKIPMIIFNNGDIDSACEAVIQAAWGHQGLVPWSVSRLLVQEDIYENFVEKLKKKLSKAKMGSADDIQSEIAYPTLIENFENKLQYLVNEAQKKGIEVYQPSQNKPFCPTLFIGGHVIRNSVLGEDDHDEVPTVTILPFRDTTEAVNLANNNKQGFAASVWTENLSLANEVSKKLKAGTIWINMHGKFRADISFTSHKCGYGNFGGAAGFHQLANWTTLTAYDLDKKTKINLEYIQKSQNEWKNQSYSKRTLKISKVALTLNNSKDKITNETSCDPKDIEKCIEWMMTMSLQPHNYNNASDVKSWTEPVGIILTSADGCEHLKNIISAIYHGNSCIVMTNLNNPCAKLIKMLESFFPGVITVIPFNPSILIDLKNDRNIAVLCHYNNMEFSMLSDITNYGITTKIKNVWYNSDYSFV